jgi:6-pyruvoyltetrahydropterin/6-carboxytetrahydropterin synthase
MSKAEYIISIQKEALKFSSAHMTVFPDGTKESIHGHNFRTRITLGTTVSNLENMLPFKDIKEKLTIICDEWDEKLLLAKDCRFFKILRNSSNSIEFELCKKRYLVPSDELCLLETDNITTESLAKIATEKFIKLYGKSRLKSQKVIWVQLQIEEIQGQGSSYKISL